VLAILLLATLAIVLLAFLTEPDPRGFGTHEQLGLAPCGMFAVTGVPCPGCGVTTAVVLAARGRVVASALTQPLGLLLALGVPLLTLWALWMNARGVDCYRQLERHRSRWVRLGLLLALCAWGFKVVQTFS